MAAPDAGIRSPAGKQDDRLTGPNFLGNLARRDGLAWLVAALARVRPPLLSSQISRPLPVTLFRPLISNNVLDRWGVLAGLVGSRRLRQVFYMAERRGITEYSALVLVLAIVHANLLAACAGQHQHVHSLPFQEPFQEQVPSLAPTPARIALVGSGECRPRCEGAVAAMTTLPSPQTFVYQISLFLAMRIRTVV